MREKIHHRLCLHKHLIKKSDNQFFAWNKMGMWGVRKLKMMTFKWMNKGSQYLLIFPIPTLLFFILCISFSISRFFIIKNKQPLIYIVHYALWRWHPSHNNISSRTRSLFSLFCTLRMCNMIPDTLLIW